MPIIAVLCLWSFVGMWNSYFDALIYLDSASKNFPVYLFTLQLAALLYCFHGRIPQGILPQHPLLTLYGSYHDPGIEILLEDCSW